ncbi:MAG: Lrp/AsnC ligand binding domain-containing protein [Candidatus Bathyarchaeota archaeon]
MVTAFMLINVKSGTDEIVVERLKDYREVKEVYEIYGAYDILVKIEEDDNKKIKEVESKFMRLRDIKTIDTIRVLKK